jgi:hypothetical protein
MLMFINAFLIKCNNILPRLSHRVGRFLELANATQILICEISTNCFAFNFQKKKKNYFTNTIYTCGLQHIHLKFGKQ